MSVAAPNQTRLKILASVLQLERFTVNELCLNAGLEPSMVYRELGDLQNEGILRSSSTRSEGGPRHRPPKLYELSTDASARRRLVEELGSFLPEFEDPNSNRHLRKVQDVLNGLVVLLNKPSEPLRSTELDSWERRLRERFDEAKKELQRATWESESDLSEESAANHPIVVATRLYESLEGQFRTQASTERDRQKSEALRAVWSELFSNAMRAVVPALSHVVSEKLVAIVDVPKISELFSVALKRQLDEQRLELKSEMFLPFVSSVQLDLREVHSGVELLAALAKHGISYGSSPTEPLQFVRELASESKDFRLLFNEANLAQLANDPEEAYESWSCYLSGLATKLEEPFTEPTLVARIAPQHWSAEAYRKAVHTIMTECEASVSALSETPFQQGEEPSSGLYLYNPLHTKSGREAAVIPIAGALAQNQRLYVVSTAADPPPVVGLPLFARAGWLRSRMEKRKAWELAAKIAPTERIVKVEFFRGATETSRLRAEKILTSSSLSAELIG
jgi:DNA-binding PadR family transcriptional regulator